jgi:Tol biopolymer transport system component
MRRSPEQILQLVYRRSHQIRLRRRMAQALAGVALIFIALLAAPGLLRQFRIQQVETADDPKTEQSDVPLPEGGKTDSDSGSGLQPPSSSGGGGRAPGGSEGSSKDSRSGGSLPAATIPRGFEIAFNCGGPSAAPGDICLMNAEGSDRRKLRAGPAWLPEWSPDASLIAFFNNNGDIQFMKSDGSGLQNLPAKGSGPTWSPDGGQLAFNWECDAQHGGPCELPDGSKKDCGPECGIGVVARDGTGVRRLGNGIWPDWGPDGRIVFGDGTPTGPWGALPIWVMNHDGSGRTKLPIDSAISPTWSHDGRRIAYFTDTDGVFIANSDGTGIKKVAPAGYEDPSWSPDGLWLALTRYTDGVDGMCSTYPVGCSHNIYLRGIDGSSERRLTSSGNDLHPAFSPRR